MSPSPAILIIIVGNFINIFFIFVFLWNFQLSETILLFVFEMAVSTHDGKKVMAAWSRRRLEDWEDDVRWNVEDDPPLVSHPKVDAPPKSEKEGLSYSKA